MTKPPMLKEAKERLQKFFETEPARLENWYLNLLGVYADAFGPEAADAFDKAVRAWHAGVEVAAEPQARRNLGRRSHHPPLPQPNQSVAANPARISARLPVPHPLPSAVAAGRFGQEEDGKPVRPGAHEVREITEQHADKLIDLLDSLASAPADGKDALRAQFAVGIAAYAEDFGQHAADQLQAYVRRQADLDPSSRRER